MSQIEHSVRRKSNSTAFSYTFKCQLVYVVLYLCFIYTNDAFPNGISPPRWPKYNNLHLQANTIQHPNIAKSSENQAISEVKYGYKSLDGLLNIVSSKRNKFNRRNPQFVTAANQSRYYNLPYWRSLMSKGWSFMTGWFHSSDKKISRRRISTDREGGIESLVASAPLWAIPAATVGMLAALRDPINAIANDIFGELSMYDTFS